MLRLLAPAMAATLVLLPVARAGAGDGDGTQPKAVPGSASQSLARRASRPLPRRGAPSPVPAARRAASASRATVHELRGGPTVVIVEDPSVPAVAITTVVRSGSRDDAPGTSGAAHFLEHLLFDGTARRTQEQVATEADALGVYSNAFTRADFTAFQMLGPPDRLEAMLDLQSDMLLASTLAPDQIEKERGVILEELAQRHARGADPEEALEREVFGWQPTDGLEADVKAMPRAAVSSRYASRYAPSDLVVFVNGDASPARALAAVRRAFKLAVRRAFKTAGRSASRPRGRVTLLGGPAPTGAGPAGWPPAADRLVTVPLAPGTGDRAWILLPAPGPADPRVVELLVLEHALSERAGDEPGLSVGADLSQESPTLRVEAEVRPGEDAAGAAPRALNWIRDAFASLAEDDVLRAARAMGASEVLQAERPHYLAFARAPLLATGSASALLALRRLPEGLDVQATLRLARELGDERRIVAVGVEPGHEAKVDPDRIQKIPVPPTPASPPRVAVSPTVPIPTRAATPPRSVGIPWQRADGGWQLPSGPNVSVEHAPGAVAAVVVLLSKERLEGEHCLPGAAEVIHRAMAHATDPSTGRPVQSTLDAIGAEMKVVDSPEIPYDDATLSPKYGYLRLRAPARELPEMVRCLGVMLRASFSDDELAAAVKEARAAVERGDRSGRERAERALAGLGLASQWWPARGSAEVLASAGLPALRGFDSSYRAGGNAVVAIVSPETDAAALRLAEGIFAGSFGGLGCGMRDPPCEPPAPPESAPLPQARVVLAQAVDVPEASRPALQAAVAVLSDALAAEVREKAGLAYSVGAEIRFEGASSVFRASLGTRPENVDRAEALVRAVLARELAAAPDPRRFAAATGRSASRELMHRLPSDGRAFESALHLLRSNMGAPAGALAAGRDGTPSSSPSKPTRSLARDASSAADVTPEHAWEVARRALHPADLKLVVVR